MWLDAAIRAKFIVTHRNFLNVTEKILILKRKEMQIKKKRENTKETMHKL